MLEHPSELQNQAYGGLRWRPISSNWLINFYCICIFIYYLGGITYGGGAKYQFANYFAVKAEYTTGTLSTDTGYDVGDLNTAIIAIEFNGIKR